MDISDIRPVQVKAVRLSFANESELLPPCLSHLRASATEGEGEPSRVFPVKAHPDGGGAGGPGRWCPVQPKIAKSKVRLRAGLRSPDLPCKFAARAGATLWLAFVFAHPRKWPPFWRQPRSAGIAVRTASERPVVCDPDADGPVAAGTPDRRFAYTLVAIVAVGLGVALTPFRCRPDRHLDGVR